MKPNDTVPDPADVVGARLHEEDAPTDPGPPPAAAGEQVLEGFGGRPAAPYAKRQPASEGRAAARYDAVGAPARSHTDPMHLPRVLVAQTSPPTSPVPVIAPAPARNATTDPARRPTVRVAVREGAPIRWIVAALVALIVVVVGTIALISRRPQEVGPSPATEAPARAPASAVLAAAPPSAAPPSAPPALAAAPPSALAASGSTDLAAVAIPPGPSASASSAVPPKASARVPERLRQPAPAPSARTDIEWTYE